MNVEGVKVVTIGGGTGSFTLLSALKNYVSHITAIVNMVDDGGSTGLLRDELGALPPGDVRQCLVALSDSSETVRDLFNYRFSEGSLEGHSFGNLFLTALEQVSGSFSDAVRTASEVLAIRGSVLPVTLSDVRLQYTAPNGKVVTGEHLIGDTDLLKGDTRPQLSFNQRALLNPHAQQALINADLIVISPGSLYGSLVPTLMVEGLHDAIKRSNAEVVYVANLTTGEDTTGYTLETFLDELERFCGGQFIDHILFNTDLPDKEILRRYAKEGQKPLKIKSRKKLSQNLLEEPLALMTSDNPDDALFRHDGDKLARQLMRIYFS